MLQALVLRGCLTQSEALEVDAECERLAACIDRGEMTEDQASAIVRDRADADFQRDKRRRQS